MEQCAWMFVAGCVAALLGGVLFLLAAVKNHRVARELREDTDRRWSLFREVQDYMMAKADPEAFAVVERKRAAKRRAAEAAGKSGKGGFSMNWTD